MGAEEDIKKVNLLTFLIFTIKKLIKILISRFAFGASEENRTPISTLARSHIDHYTTPAHKYSIKKNFDLQVYFITIS